jgi:hypothetical protein
MMVRFTSTYGSCHGHDYMIVGFTSTSDRGHGIDCMIDNEQISNENLD